MDAKLSDLTFTPGSSVAITYTKDGIAINDVVKTGKTKSFTVTVTYNANSTGQLSETDKIANVNMILSFVQTKKTV